MQRAWRANAQETPRPLYANTHAATDVLEVRYSNADNAGESTITYYSTATRNADNAGEKNEYVLLCSDADKTAYEYKPALMM